jgi:hypothetical protein
MLKLKYLRHPFQTAKAVKALLTTRLDMWRFATHGERRFRNDVRYDLQNVTDGFISRIDDFDDDTNLLERICSAYIKSAAQEQLPPDAYRAPERWQRVRQQHLGPIIHALIGNSRASKSISDSVHQIYDSFNLAETRSSGWHSHKVSGAGVGGAASLAASTLFEQRYTRASALQNK